MKAFLQGRWLGHPLHPLLVHFPIGLWVLSLLLDILSFFIKGGCGLFGCFHPMLGASFYCLVAGTGMALLAAIPGLADWADIRGDHEAKKPATYHMILNFVAIGLYILNSLLRIPSADARTVAPEELYQELFWPLPFIMSIVGVGLISVSGYLGGLVVYDDGVGVGRHRRKTELPDETLKVNGEGEWVEVGDAGSLQEGGTLRADVKGHVMTIVKAGGEVYAFQEFCTHRFGPLSEGAMIDGQIECPWHRSCFDVRTGKVTQGPAKLDLKTYQAEVRDGKIRVKVASSD